MNTKSYFSQYESPNIVIVPTMSLCNPERRKIGNNILVPIVDNATCEKNKFLQEQGQSQILNAFDDKKNDSNINPSKNPTKKVSWASNYLHSIGLDSKSSIWQHKIPRKSASKRCTTSEISCDIMKSNVTSNSTYSTNIEADKCDQSKKPKTVTEVNFEDKLNQEHVTETQISKTQNIKYKDSSKEKSLSQKECVKQVTQKNIQSSKNNSNIPNKKSNVIEKIKTDNTIKLNLLKKTKTDSTGCTSMEEKHSSPKKPVKVIKAAEKHNSSKISIDQSKITRRQKVPDKVNKCGFKPVTIKQNNKEEKITDNVNNKLKQNKNYAERSKPSTSNFKDNLGTKYTPPQCSIGQVTSVKSVVKVTKKYDVNDLNKLTALKTSKKTNKVNCNREDLRKNTKMQSSRKKSDSKSTSTKHTKTIKSPIKKESHKTKKYRKIKLVINVVCNNKTNSPCKSSESDKASTECAMQNVDLEFLNDFDVDEIVESLNICDQEMKKQHSGMSFKEESKDSNMSASTYDNDALDLIEILKGEEDDGLIKQSIDGVGELFSSANLQNHSHRSIESHNTPESGSINNKSDIIANTQLEAPVKIKEENQNFEIFSEIKGSSSPDQAADLQNLIHCKTTTDNIQTNSESKLILKHDIVPNMINVCDINITPNKSNNFNKLHTGEPIQTTIITKDCHTFNKPLDIENNSNITNDKNTGETEPIITMDIKLKQDIDNLYSHSLGTNSIPLKIIDDVIYNMNNNYANSKETKNSDQQNDTKIKTDIKFNETEAQEAECKENIKEYNKNYPLCANSDDKEGCCEKESVMDTENSIYNGIENADTENKQSDHGDTKVIENQDIKMYKETILINNETKKYAVEENQSENNDSKSLKTSDISNKDYEQQEHEDITKVLSKKENIEGQNCNANFEKSVNQVKDKKINFTNNRQIIADQLNCKDKPEENKRAKMKAESVSIVQESATSSGKKEEVKNCKYLNDEGKTTEKYFNEVFNKCKPKNYSSSRVAKLRNDKKRVLSPSCRYIKSNTDEEITSKVEQRMFAYLGTKYSITRAIHYGKFSTIFECKHPNEKVYAIKSLKIDSESMNMKKKQMLYSLQNGIPKNNLFTVYLVNAFNFGNKWYILMDYYPQNLEQVLTENQKPFCVQQIQNYARQLVTAVMVLKINNMVHADIKPKHILMNTFNNKLKLCGFDNLCYVNELHVLPNIGTVNYRAPEVILGYPASFEIDVWSTALVLYEMAVKHKLLPGAFNNDILYKQMCTLGTVPCEMIKKSRYASPHFSGINFKRKIGFKGQKINIIKSIVKNNKLSKSIYDAYYKNWADRRNVPEQNRDIEKLTLFVTLLEKMLIMHPRYRLSIEFVYDHPFIYDAYEYQEW